MFFKILFILMLFSLPSCFKKEKVLKPEFKNIEKNLEIELLKTESSQLKKEILSPNLKEQVSIIHHLKNTGFHFYNEVNPIDDKKIALVGGAGLRIRLTDDGGEKWRGYQFSKFSNVFYSSASKNNELYAVGESPYIFKTSDNGKSWSFFDTDLLMKEKIINSQFKFPKIKFFNNKFGVLVGCKNSKPLFLTSLDGGVTWNNIEFKKEFKDVDVCVLNTHIFDEENIIVVTQGGRVLRTRDGGKTWTVSYKSLASLNSIQFNGKVGLVGGIGGNLLYTRDGGASWSPVEFPFKTKNFNFSDITFYKELFYVTSSLVRARTYELDQYVKDKNICIFSYVIDIKGKYKRNLLSLSHEEVSCAKDSYSIEIDSDNENVFLLDRNNLYKFKTL